MRIMVLDDDTAFLAMMRAYLVAKGHDVKATTSWREITNDLDNNDLLLLDVNMPELPGPKLAKILGKWTRFPVVFLSGDTDENLQKLVDECQVYGYLRKGSQMFTELEKILRGL